MQTDVRAMCRFQLGFDTGEFETRYLASYMYEDYALSADALGDVNAAVFDPLHPLHYNHRYPH